MIMYLNNHLFSKNYGMAGAVSVVLFLVCAVLCVVVYFSLTKEDDGLTKAQRKELNAAKKAAQRREMIMAHTPRNQSEKATLAARRAWCYLVLVLISFLCLFFFYVLVINSTRTHFEIQKGLLDAAGQIAHHQLPERAGRRQHPCHHRHPQQPDRLRLLGGVQRVFLGP